jgi:multiple antibiotic resistance protein
MAEWFPVFTSAFVPLFIVIDALGLPPLITSLTEGMTFREQTKMVHIAILTALVVGLAFLFFGRLILTLMGISVGAFAIAGGSILMVQAIRSLTTGHMIEAEREEMVAVVPIGTPLLAGPATITTLLLLTSQLPLNIVLAAFVANVVVAWLICLGSYRILRVMGHGGLKAVSRVFSLLLAAIAVSMILRGLALSGIIASIP